MYILSNTSPCMWTGDIAKLELIKLLGSGPTIYIMLSNAIKSQLVKRG